MAEEVIDPTVQSGGSCSLLCSHHDSRKVQESEASISSYCPAPPPALKFRRRSKILREVLPCSQNEKGYQEKNGPTKELPQNKNGTKALESWGPVAPALRNYPLGMSLPRYAVLQHRPLASKLSLPLTNLNVEAGNLISGVRIELENRFEL